MTSLKWPDQYEDLSKRAVEVLHLLAEGMTDREIAARLVMTINTVKWYNRQIYSILGVGSRTQAIACARERGILKDEVMTTPVMQIIPHRTRNNLPVETTHFIGRKHEMKVIKHLLNTARLLTLVGTPGTGKTRLARQVAREVLEVFRHGVYFVQLEAIDDPALVIKVIAHTVGVNEVPGQTLMETLKLSLCESRVLLILDNFEHLLAAAPQISELLSVAPHLKVLATSREPLHLYGEQEYVVPALELPDSKHLNPEEIVACESVALFVQRACAVRADFELTPENTLDVAQICLRLEGLPLAIELAAARLKVLSLPILLDRLSNRLAILIGGPQDLPARQRTLRNTIEWSYNLLNENEKRLFARLAIFPGNFTVKAVEAICLDDLTQDVFDGLIALVDKNLVQHQESLKGEHQFTMLETIREYAAEALEKSGEAQMLYSRRTT